MRRALVKKYRGFAPQKSEGYAFSVKKLLFWISFGAIIGVLVPSLLIFIIYTLYYPQLPDPRMIEDHQPALVTRIYSADGVVLAEFAGEKRIWMPVSEMSENITHAFLSVEDKRFFDHWGIDISAIFRAIYIDVKRGRRAQGASTITQQLTRELFLTREKLFTRKIREALTALKIERMYSKTEILELFLNQQYLGKGCYGVEAACNYYFGKESSEVSELEAATIAGLLQAPSRYPNNLEMLKNRRNLVLSLMAGNNYLGNNTLDSLTALEVGIRVDQEAISWKAPYFVENIRKYIERQYGESYLYERGITIYSTLDWELQQIAEEAFENKLASLERWQRKIHHDNDPIYTHMVYDTLTGDSIRQWKDLQGAMLAMVPSTGEILVMIGGRDYLKSQYNRAIQGGRQAGSAFKPFVYTAAIDNGWTPVDTLLDTPEVYPMEGGEIWAPKNYDHEYRGVVTLRSALGSSRNAATVKLCNEVGPKRVVWCAQRMGISTHLEPYLSIAMGTSDVKLIDMVEAYSVFPNMGVKVEPTAIRRIIDRDGKVIEHRTPVKEEVLPPATAYVMTNMLQTVIDHGTGYPARLKGFDRPAGGKTGTTNEYSDAWFVGFTPQITCGVQVGYDDYSTPIGSGQTGASAALPIWTELMLKAHAPERLPLLDFTIPTGQVAFVDVCKESYKLATNQCPKVAHEVFVSGTQPTDYCPPGFHTRQDRPIFDRRLPTSDDKTTPDLQGDRPSEQRGRF